MSKEVKLDGEAKEVNRSCDSTRWTLPLADVTYVAKKAGFVYPVYITLSLLRLCRYICPGIERLSLDDRIWLFLSALRSNPEVPLESCQKQWSCVFLVTDDMYCFGLIKVVRGLDENGERFIQLMHPYD
jgi:hypothetical protein